jgi:transcription-repair coupling factor (superfamily II helicase)
MPSLKLQELLRSAAARSGIGAQGPRVSGLSPSAKALFAGAAATRDARGEVVLMVVATDRDVDQMTADIRFFLGGLEGATSAELEQAVQPFPSQEVDPYRGMTPHMRVTSARARALHALATGHARVVVASATALMPRVAAPSRMMDAALELKPGLEIDPLRLAEKLVEAGFTRADPVEEHGAFCIRGGVADIFPAGDDQPARLEFIGDTIEMIRRFDPATQRSVATIDTLRIVPLLDWLEEQGLGTDSVPRAESREPLGTDAVPPAASRQPAQSEPWRVDGPPADRSSLFSYLSLSRRPVVLVSEPDEVQERVEAWLAQVGESYSDSLARASGESGSGRSRAVAASIPAPDTILLSWPEIQRALASATALEELDVEHTPESATDDAPDPSIARARQAVPLPTVERARQAVPLRTVPLPPSPGHIACQPALSFSGRLSEWVSEVKRARDRHDTVVFVAATPGRAERIVEVLADYELRAVQIDRAEDAYAASVYVTTGLLSRGFRLPSAGLQIYAESDVFEEERRPSERRQSVARTFLSDFRDLKPGDFVVHVDHGIGAFVGLRQLGIGATTMQAPPATSLPRASLGESKGRPLVLSEPRRVEGPQAALAPTKPAGQATGEVASRQPPAASRQPPTAMSGIPVQEFLELRYAGDDKLFVPVDRLDLIQKYTGGAHPGLDRLGGTTWEKAKQRVKKAMRDMAEELLKLYAARKAITGHAFPSDTHWQEEFENAFPWELTPDQQTAIEDIKRDLESSTPMDRLLCGDVGYGKTEVAMRAAFKVVMDGKQVAFLAPTTVLTFQHVKTLRERFSGFPIRIDSISRFRTPSEQKETLADLSAGKVDVIVGTHRLLSKDVAFRDLGLLVVDEEQRFGVAHKERIKHLRKKVDVLTMTATPIPRTLNMSLVGIRDMSIIETPPKDRLAIQTNVVKFNQQVITRAIRNELERGGQVYFVHNRVESIYSMGNLITRLVPEARVVIGHGQLGEHDLEKAMIGFVAHKFDILLATTIVENGLDIPNVNTIIINRSDRYGLAQLYQLRGRVGRSDRPAYAYLLIPPEDNLSPVAKKRLAAIREFSDLGSGFRVAALDLEIRGAGNLLGGEQSGQIDAVGFEMYMKLLEQTVRELKGEELEDEVRAAVNLGIDLRISEDFVPDMSQRLVLYRRVAAARNDRELDVVMDEIRDRYGPPPESVLSLEAFGRIRLMADRLGVESLDRQGSIVVLKFRDDGRRAPDPTRIIKMVRERQDVQLVPPGTIKLKLGAVQAGKAARAGQHGAEADRRSAGTGSQPAPRGGSSSWQPPRGSGVGGGVPSRPFPGGPARFDPRESKQNEPPREPGRSEVSRSPGPESRVSKSWWTARATAGEVKPGFTKEEILRPPKEDPRAPGGVFTQVDALLRALLDEKPRS